MNSLLKKYLTNINESTITNGKIYYEESKVQKINFDLEGPINTISFISNGYATKVELTSDRIFSYKCECIVGKHGVICKHVVAAILHYVNKLETDELFFINNELLKNVEDPEIRKIIFELKANNQLFEVELMPFFIQVKYINEPLLKKILEKYDEIKIEIEKILNSNKEKNTKEIREILEEKIKIKKLYEICSTQPSGKIQDKKLIESFFENVNNSVGFKIKTNKYFLPVEKNIKKSIDINVAKTSIGYLISTDINDGCFINVDDEVYFIMVFSNKILWHQAKWDESNNPNLFLKLGLRIKSDNLFWEKINEIKNTSYFEANIIGLEKIDKQEPRIQLYFDEYEEVCVLKIFNDIKLIKRYFSKYSNDFTYLENEFYYKTISVKTINEIFTTLKYIREKESINIAIDKKLLPKRKRKIKFNFNFFNNGLKLKINSDVDDKVLKKIYQAYNQGKKFVQIDSILYDVEEFDFSHLNYELSQMGINKIDNSLEYDIDTKNLFYLSSKFSSKDLEKKVNEFENEIKGYKFVTKKDAPLLKEYQLYGVNWLINILKISNGCILADEMGLGKTIQTIHFLKYVYKNNDKEQNPTLIIVPLSLVSNWETEFKKFYPEKKLITIMGSKEERNYEIERIKNNNIYITTYSLIKNDIDELKKYKFLNVILDEGQYIKNFTSNWTRDIKKLNSTNRIILSGTPIENNLLELWSIFDFIIPNYLSSLKKFKTKYVTPNIDEKDLYELSLKIKQFILQRRKCDHLDIPDKQINNIYIKMSDTERDKYLELLDGLKQKINISIDKENHIVNNKIEILALITKLRQFCCCPKLLGYDNLNDTKLKKCIELVNEIIQKDKNAKIVIFSNFKTMLELLNKTLISAGYNSLLMTGNNRWYERNSIINKFSSNNNDHNILLISLKVGGVGLNLSFANNVILYNPWWNESAELQATDRLHRMGQEKNVNVFKLICEDSIESNIELLKKNKIDIIEKTFNNLNYNDLLKILGKN